MEMKVILAMTARRLDITLAYEDVDGARGSEAIESVDRERSYQILRAQLSENLPCRVAALKIGRLPLRFPKIN